MEEFFRPKEKTAYRSLPFITRPEQKENFIFFASENDGFEVLLHRNVQETIRREAFDAAPNETIGLLAGRVVRDERGPYTLVLAAAGAQPNEVEATPSHVRISASGQAQVRSRLESLAHGLDIIGWYHSHPHYPARFSPVDIAEQSTWRDPNHIGIVISGVDRNEPFGVYRGPQSNLLVPKISLQSLMNPQERTEPMFVVKPAAGAPAVIEPEPAGALVAPDSNRSSKPAEVSASESRKKVAFTYVAFGVGLFSIMLGIVWLNNRLSRMEARLTSLRVDREQSLTPQSEPLPSRENAVPLHVSSEQNLSLPKPETGAKPLSLHSSVKEPKRRAKRTKKTPAGEKGTPAQKQSQ